MALVKVIGQGTQRGLTRAVEPEEYPEPVNPGRQHLVADYLRELVMALESGDVQADSVVVFLTLNEATRAYFTGYDIQREITDAISDGQLGIYMGDRWNPDEQAERRNFNHKKQREEEEAKRLATPWVCYCASRHATEAGLRQHTRIATKGDGIGTGSRMGITYAGEDGRIAHYNEEYAQQIGRGDVGLACELHGFREFYEGKPRHPLGLRM